MKRSLSLFAAISCGLLLGTSLKAQTVATNPVGFNSVTVTQATTASLGIPFDRPADFVGLVSSHTSNSVTVSGTPWNAGDYGPFTDPTPANTKPHMIRMLSGANVGRDYKIDNNTNNTLTITTGGNLTSQIADGDQFQIFPCHTLASLFGTDGAGLQSGNSSTADLIQLREGGAWITYFHTTGVSGFWAQSGGGSTNFNNHPVLPYSGFLLVRRASSNFTFTALGAVPTTDLKTDLPANATTHFGNRFPVDTTLNNLGLTTAAGTTWVSANSSTNADQVLMRINNAWFTYFHTTGVSGFWAQVGDGANNHNNDPIPTGAAVLIVRRPGSDMTLPQTRPYTLP